MHQAILRGHQEVLSLLLKYNLAKKKVDIKDFHEGNTGKKNKTNSNDNN